MGPSQTSSCSHFCVNGSDIIWKMECERFWKQLQSCLDFSRREVLRNHPKSLLKHPFSGLTSQILAVKSRLGQELLELRTGRGCRARSVLPGRTDGKSGTVLVGGMSLAWSPARDGATRGLWGSSPPCPPTLLGACQGVSPHYIGASAALLPPQLQSSDFVVLKRLVPLLEELSRTYPEPLTQELASDLRIAICTHGACSPSAVGAAADGVLGRKPGTGAQSPAGVPSRAPGPPSPRHGHGSPSAHRERSEEQNTRHEPSASGASPAPYANSPAPAGLQELLVSAYDPQPPSRAAALRHLASLVTQRDPEALRLQEKLLQVPGFCCGPCPLPWSLSPAVSPIPCPVPAELALNVPSGWRWL